MSTANDDPDLVNIGYVFISVSGLIAFLIAFFVWYRWDSPKEKSSDKGSSDSSPEHSEEEVVKEVKKPNPFRQTSKQSKWKSDKMREANYEHPWLLTTLKGHVNRVSDIDFSPNGKFLVSVCDDRTIFLWYLKDLKEREHKFARGNVELDNATHVAFAPDSKSVLLSLGLANKLAVYKVVRKEDGQSGYRFIYAENIDFPVTHVRDISSVGIACNGKFLMSSSEDNKIVIYGVRGDVYKIVEPKLNILYECLISPCGRFVAASGFTPDVFVFEVLFDRQGNFQDVKRAFDLKGHTSGILSFGFNQNSSRCVTASKDGTWKVYDTDIRYGQGEEAKILASGEWDLLKSASPETVCLAVSPSGNSFAIGASRHLQLFSTLEPDKQFNTILDVHQEPLRRIRMSSCGKMIATCGDRHIRVFNNIAEYFSTVISLERSVRSAREDAHKRRLQEQLEDAKKELSSVTSK